MLSHIASDLHQAYLEEVFKPQLGKPGASAPTKPTSPADLDGDGNVDSFEKKVRQFIYDVRHLMRKQNIPVERAFQMRSSKTNYGAEVIKTAKEKLGIKGGGAAPVSEEVGTEKLYSIVINYKNGTTYRKRTSRSEINRLRSNPNVSSVEMTKYGVDGLAKKDYDGDGKIESGSKEHAGAVHNAIQRSTGGTPDGQDTRRKTSKKKLKSYGVSEGFSNWRQDLKEVLDVNDEMASRDEKQIKEKNVNNYAGGKDSVVKINPEVTEEVEILGGYIVESFELNEEYLNEAVDIATEFFYNYGLNENGVDIVIEELGEEKFAEFVFDLAEEYFLSEARTLTGKKTSPATGKQLGISRKAAPGKRTKAAVEKHGTTRTLSSSSPSGTIKKRDIGKKIRGDEVDKAIKTAEKEQAPSSEKSRPAGQERIRKTVNDTISRVTSPEARKSVAKTAGNLARGAADTLARGALSAWQGHKKAMDTKKKGGSVAQQLGSGAGTALKSFFTKGTKQFREWVEYLISEGYDLSDWTTEELYEEYGYLCEEAESEQQQKLFGLALSVKRGETPRSEVSAEVLKIVDSMSEKKIRDFAKTPHSEVPKKKVTEAIANPKGGKKSPKVTQRQKDAVGIQTDNAREKIGEDVDSFATDNPILSTLNVRIARLKAQNDPNKAKQLATLIAQQQRLELEASKKRLRTNTQTLQPQTQNASYEPEGESIDERTRYAKKTEKHFRTGRPSIKGGNPEVAATNKPPLKFGGSRQEPKERGKKPPSPSEDARKKGVLSPLEHKVALVKAQRKRAEQQAGDMYKPRAGESD